MNKKYLAFMPLLMAALFFMSGTIFAQEGIPIPAGANVAPAAVTAPKDSTQPDSIKIVGSMFEERRTTVSNNVKRPPKKGPKKAFPKTWNFTADSYVKVERMNPLTQQMEISEWPQKDDPMSDVIVSVYAMAKKPIKLSEPIRILLTKRNFKDPQGEITISGNQVVNFSDLPPTTIEAIKKLDGSYYMGTTFEIPYLAQYMYLWSRSDFEENEGKWSDNLVKPDVTEVDEIPVEYHNSFVALIMEFNKRPLLVDVLDASFDNGTEFMMGGVDPVSLNIGRTKMNFRFGLGSRVSTPGITPESDAAYAGIKFIKGLSLNYIGHLNSSTAFWGPKDGFIKNKLAFGAVHSNYIEVAGSLLSSVFSDMTGIRFSYMYRVGSSYGGPIGTFVDPDDTTKIYKTYVVDGKSYFNWSVNLDLQNIFDGKNHYSINYYEKEYYALIEFDRMDFGYTVATFRANWRFYSPEKNRSRLALGLNFGFPSQYLPDFVTIGGQVVIGQGPAYFEPVISFRIPTSTVQRNRLDYSREQEADAE